MVMKVLLLDDHPLILSAMQAMIASMRGDVTVLAADTAGEAHVLLADHGDVDLVLLDLTLADADGFLTLAKMRGDHPGLAVVVISATEAMADVVRAVDLGAMGFVSKRSSNDELARALALVMSGGVYLPAALLGQADMPMLAAAPPAPTDQAPGDAAADNNAGLTAEPTAAQPLSPAGPPGREVFIALGLTPRQIDVLNLLLKGLPNKLIARELNLSVETIKDHVAAVLRALGVASRTQAVLAVGQLSQRPSGDVALRPRPRR